MTSSWITTIKRTAATVFTAAAVLVSGCSSPETSDMTSLNSYKYEQELNIIDDNFRNYYQIFVGSARWRISKTSPQSAKSAA